MQTASQMQYTGTMKSANLPPLRVEPQLRNDIERVLRPGESLSSFVETAVRTAVHMRELQADFIARGLESIAQVENGQATLPAGEMFRHLDQTIEQAFASRGIRRTR